jgi:hypothetical protein
MTAVGIYEVRSPKFIWTPCAQQCSLAVTPQPPPPDLSLCTMALSVSQDRRHQFKKWRQLYNNILVPRKTTTIYAGVRQYLTQNSFGSLQVRGDLTEINIIGVNLGTGSRIHRFLTGVKTSLKWG